MRVTFYLLRKEFSQILRNSVIARAIFIVPLLQMLVLVPAVTFEIRNVKIAVADYDLSATSRRLVNRLEGSEFFTITGYAPSTEQALTSMQGNECDVVMVFPEGFEKEIITGKGADLQVIVNAINAMSAQLSWAYISGVIRDFNTGLLTGDGGISATMQAVPVISVANRFWYNTMLNYKYYMLPGI
ncbi:MAG: ABC transporter permease, partial [Bacteroidales bacterium]|nr:ABC transporter permease [Bacteroidales bacterium]